MSQPSVVLATASYDHTIRFWEAEIGRCYRTIQYPESQVNRVEITPDKCGIAAAGNPHIRLFDVNSNSSAGMPSYFAWELFSSQVLINLVSASSNSTARLWSMSNGEEIKFYIGHQKATVCCALHDGNEPSS